MKWLDLPPIWLLGFIALAWGVARMTPGLNLSFQWQGPLALVCMIVGLVLMALAILEMSRARTTVIPRRQPSRLVTSGIFSFTRNPIYLGDALVLTGAVIWLGSILTVPLITVFTFLITKRFIVGEEEWIGREFGEEFKVWTKKTRRWL